MQPVDLWYKIWKIKLQLVWGLDLGTNVIQHNKCICTRDVPSNDDRKKNFTSQDTGFLLQMIIKFERMHSLIVHIHCRQSCLSNVIKQHCKRGINKALIILVIIIFFFQITFHFNWKK